jgi:membrane-associated phospholipid phosphatase
MPVVIAVVIAGAIVAAVLALVELVAKPRTDPVDVRAPAVKVASFTRRHSRVRHFVRKRVDPTAATGLVLTVALGITAAAILAIGSLLEMVQTKRGFAHWDDSAARWGAEHSTDATRTVLRAITQLGSTSVVIVIAIVVTLLQRDRISRIHVGAFLATVITSTVLLNNLVKLIVDRTRPDIARFVGASGSSFPSGHSASAAATYAALALVFGRGTTRRTWSLLAAGAGAVATAVAASRVLLGVHWLTDVIAGMALGWGCFALSSIAFGGRLLKFGQPVAAAKAQASAPTTSNTQLALDDRKVRT